VELGGHDQIFNLLVGRDLMKDAGLEPQVVLTVPLLVGTDGVDKMSKSLDNHIAFEDEAREIYGKTMSIPDTLMWDWYLLLTDRPQDELEALKARADAGEIHPKSVKEELAALLTRRFHGEEAARAAATEFEKVFSRRGLPDDIPLLRLEAGAPLHQLLHDAGLAKSKSDARRLIEQGAVSLDGERAADPFNQPERRSEPYLVKVGKRRFLRLLLN
jgi:tyrosyl-tRNA synthetase